MLSVSVHRYGGDAILRQVIDEMQAKLHCCGADGYGDWSRIFWVGNASVTSRKELAVPPSCCDRATYSECVTRVPGDLPEVLTIYKRGCSSVLKQHLRYTLSIFHTTLKDADGASHLVYLRIQKVWVNCDKMSFTLNK